MPTRVPLGAPLDKMDALEPRAWDEGTSAGAGCPPTGNVRARVPFGYPLAVAIVACPFCREMFEGGEAESCPVCGIALRALDKLPRADSLLHEFEDDGVPPSPEELPFPLTYGGRGRGALIVMGIVGLALFFLPWVHLTLPYIADLSGFDLAKRLGWSWSGGVAWVVLVPTVASRRTIARLRGARFAASFLSLIPAVTAAILTVFPPHGGLVPVRFTFGWAVWSTIVVSLGAVFVGARLGGRVDLMTVPRGSSAGKTLH